MKRARAFALLTAAVLAFSCRVRPVPSEAAAAPAETLQSVSPFPVGVAVAGRLLETNAAYRDIVLREYGSITPENAAKIEALHPSQDAFDFSDLDRLVAFASSHAKRVHGVALIWHDTSGLEWLRDFRGDAAAWERMFRTHIQTVARRYRGKIRSWDVVNEAFNNDGTLRADDESATDRLGSAWARNLGNDYIARAFQYAHEADPDALLFYNDFELYDPGKPKKIEAVLAMIDDFRRRGIPIHGIGVQMHVGVSADEAGISAALRRLAATGLMIHISELDILVSDWKKDPALVYTEELQERQADKYRFIAEAYARSVPPAQRYGVTVWNVGDADSWIPAAFGLRDWPLPFDSLYRRKKAYYGFLEGLKPPSQGNVASLAARPVLTVTVDRARPEGPLDKGRVLNGSEGGYEAMRNLRWLPGAYDDLAAAGLQMIRLDHLTNDKFYRVVSRDAAGRLRFDFSRLDRVIDPMIEKGMRPFMCLSYAPGALAPMDPGLVVSDLEEWAQVVRAYVRHFKDKGHAGWYWEVWNEPDQKSFFGGDARRYVDLSAATAAAVKGVDPTARVGGAADSDPSSPDGRLGPLVGHVRAHPEVPLDFVSYHRYCDPNGDGQPPFDLEWRDDVVRDLAKLPGPPRETFVTEWNLTPVMDAGPGSVTDTNVLAAGAAVMIYKAFETPSLRRVFYFSPIEGFRPSRVFNGDLGLLTVNGHQKAIYNLFLMISRLGDTMLRTEVHGDHTDGNASYALATRDPAGRTAVLVWNYWDKETTLKLSVSHVIPEAGNAVVKATRWVVDGGHGNYYRDYRAGHRGRKAGPTESLEPTEHRVPVSGGTFAWTERLAPFSVSLYLLEPEGPAASTASRDASGDRPKLTRAAGKPVTASISANAAGGRS